MLHIIVHVILIALPFVFGQHFQHLMEGLSVLNWKDVTLIQQNWNSIDLKRLLKSTDISTKVVRLEDVKCKQVQHLVITDESLQCFDKSVAPYDLLIIGSNPTFNQQLTISAGIYFMTSDGILQVCLVIKHNSTIDHCCMKHGNKPNLQGIHLLGSQTNAAIGDDTIAELIVQEMSNELNFTISYHLPEDTKDWGSVPKNGKWEDTGVYGQLVNSDFDIIGNTFSINENRLLTTDYLQPFFRYDIKLYVNMNLVPDACDWTFFTSPFDIHTWVVMLSAYGSFAGAYLCMIKLFAIKNVKTGLECMSLNGWLLFTMLFAFYSGAQTMFLATPKELPMNSVSDAIKAYPTWNLISLTNDTLYIEMNADAGKLEFVEYQKRLKSGTYNYLVNSITVSWTTITLRQRSMSQDVLYEKRRVIPFLQDGIRMIETTSGTVFYASSYEMNRVRVLGYKSSIPLYSFGGEDFSTGGILVKKNSPLRRFMNPILTKMREDGRIDQIMEHVIRTDGIKYQSNTNTNAELSFLHVFIWFGLYILGVALGLIIFAVEFCMHNHNIFSMFM
jgi:hypothetical protein